MTACDLCGADVGPTDLVDAELVDRRGGSGLSLCPDCRDQIDAPRCRVCGDPMAGGDDAAGVFFPDDVDGDRPEIHGVCDDCRATLLFGGGSE